MFLAHRSAESVEEQDNNFPPINWADVKVDETDKSAMATVAGFKENKAVYREGLGAVLINDDYDADAKYLVPQRNFINTNLPYPYGNQPQKDTLFSNVNYKKLDAAIQIAF